MTEFDDDGRRSLAQTLRIRALETTIAKTRLIACRDDIVKQIAGLKTLTGLNVDDPTSFKVAVELAVKILRGSVDAANGAIAQSQYLGSVIQRIPGED